MDLLEIKDKRFELYLPEEVIREAVAKVSNRMNNDLQGKNPLFICVLNGAFMFASDLLKQFESHCEITFIRLKSYEGTASVGRMLEVQGLVEDIKGRHIVVVEDIIDTGRTMAHLLSELKGRGPASIKVATLLLKPDALQIPLSPDYVALEIPNRFIVGYGLDYDGQGRNLRCIYKIVD